MEGDDTALSLVLGLVCERCDAYNDPGVPACSSCGAPLGDGASPELPAEFMELLPDPEGAPLTPAMPLQPDAPAAPAPAAPAPSPATTPMATPSWMEAPTGQPIATAFALPKVDLSDLKRAAQSLAAPLAGVPASARTPSPPPSTAAPRAATCGKCQAALEPGDKFCRNCGTRVGEPAVTHTMQIPVARPGALPSPVLGAGPAATAMMPSFRSVGVEPAAGLGQSTPTTTMMFGAVTAERSAKLVLVRGQSSFGTQWRIQAGETLIGRTEGVVLFPDDTSMAARHARLVFSGPDLVLDPLPSTNGVFVRVKEPTRLEPGDEIVLGAERLVVLDKADRPAVARQVADDGTRPLGSLLKSQEPISLLRASANPAANEVFYRAQRLVTLGRSHCDVNFPRDSFVSERHAQISRGDSGALLLEDLRSRNGTYLRARKPTRLHHGDLMLLGDKVLRIELPQR